LQLAILLVGHDKIHVVYYYYHCGADVTLIVHFCCEFCAINMDTPHLICTEKKNGSDPFLWAEDVPGVEMHRRMSVQYGNKSHVTMDCL
jgi:hypothetical protein